MAKARSRKKPAAARQMTTGEAVVAALSAHGLDTIYALPGVHNDAFFDALARNAETIRTVHTRHEQGAAYMALGAALATGKPQAYCVVPGPGLLNSSAALLTAYGMNAPVLALIGQNPGEAHRPRVRLLARNRRPARHHRTAGRLVGAHPLAARGAAPGRQGDPVHVRRASRPGGARMRDRRVGAVRPGAPSRRRCGCRYRRSTRTPSRPQQSVSAPPKGR